MKKTVWLTLIIAVLVVSVDQVIKSLVATYLPPGGAWSPLPGPNPIFQIVHTFNTGVAFGLFKDLGPVFTLVALIVSGAIIYYARRLREDQKLIAVALGLILGGTIGNAIDRIRLGHVIDFFDVGIGAMRNASNLADWSLVLGVILLSVAMLIEDRSGRQKPNHGDTETRSVRS